VHEIEALFGRQAVDELDLEALEMAVRQQALPLAARAVEPRLNADTSDNAGPHLACRGGGETRYAGRRAKRFHSVLGSLQWERAYDHGGSCGGGFCPRDRSLGLENSSLSPAVTRRVGTVGALVSFQEGSALLQELAGVAVDAKQVERTAEALGTEIAAAERKDLKPAPHHLPLPVTLYLGIDATGIPLRAEEWAGRQGKQPEGSAKTREVKRCTVGSAESRDEHDTPVRDEGSVTYSAAIQSAASPDTASQRSEFSERVWGEAPRRCFTQVACPVVLGDGAPWICNLAHELFPQARQIVDRFHAQEPLSNLAKTLEGPANPRAPAGAQRRPPELDTGRFDALLAAVRRRASTCEDARRTLHYFQTNRHRLRYPEFHAQGLCTSTGVVEAGCKVALGTRLKRAGMPWTLPGSNAIIALRCCKLSGRFQDFWERRSTPRTA